MLRAIAPDIATGRFSTLSRETTANHRQRSSADAAEASRDGEECVLAHHGKRRSHFVPTGASKAWRRQPEVVTSIIAAIGRSPQLRAMDA